MAAAAFPDLPGARSRFGEARGGVSGAMKQRDADLAPKFTALRDAMNAPPPEPMAPVKLADPPSRKLTELFAPVNGEPPEQSIGKMVGALGLFAQMGGAIARGHARSALAAWTGSLKGWQQGDTERSDREYADWGAATRKLITEHNSELDHYDSLLKARDKTIEERLRDVKMSALEKGSKILAAQTDAETAEKMLGILTKERDHADQVEHWRQQVEASREAAKGTEAYRQAHLAIERGKLDLQQQQRRDAVAALGEEGLTSLGQQWALGKLPAQFARNKELLPQIVQHGIKWAKDNGINLNDLPTIQAEVAAARTNMVDNGKRMTVAGNAVGTFERHMQQLVSLGKTVGRYDQPVVNRVYLKAKGQYQGDADVAAYEAMAFEAAQEFAKVSVGTAQGDAGTREEARRVITGALNQAQLEAVAKNLTQAAESRMAQYRQEQERLTGIVNSAGGRIEIPGKPGGTPQGGPAPAGAVMGGRRLAVQNKEQFWIPADTDLTKIPGAAWAK